MSTLWPNGEDKSLVYAIVNYLKQLPSSSLSDDQKESLNVSIDSLLATLDVHTVPSVSFNLVDLYANYLAEHDQKLDDGVSKNELTPELQERKKKFLDFVEVLKKHNFFNNCDEKSQEYFNRLEQARKKYNDKFPALAVPSLQELQITSDKIQSQSSTTTTQSSPGLESEDIKTPEQKKQMAEQFKNEGNELLSQQKFNDAIKKYSDAIALLPDNAVYYCNRAAAYTHTKNFANATRDAKKATSLDPEYTKAYVRLGLAEYEQHNYQEALDAYQQVVNRTPSNDPNWETYVEKVQLCKQKLEINTSSNPMNVDEDDENPLNNMGDLLGSLGGGGGGGAGMQNLFSNPMFHQMAQQVLGNPQMMQQMGQMMNNPQFSNMAKNFMGSGSGVQGNDDSNSKFMELLKNPVKAREVFVKVKEDPDFIELEKSDPDLAQTVQGLENGDMSAASQLLSKPDILTQLKKIIKKYL